MLCVLAASATVLTGLIFPKAGNPEGGDYMKRKEPGAEELGDIIS